MYCGELDLEMIEYINPGGDYLGLNNVDKIKCPDCNRAYLKKSKFSDSIWICPECALKINDNELTMQSKYMPDVGQYGKPFDTQKAANTPHSQTDDGRAFVVGNSMAKDLAATSIRGMALAKNQGMDIQSNKAISKETVDVVKQTAKFLKDKQEVKINLE